MKKLSIVIICTLVLSLTFFAAAACQAKSNKLPPRTPIAQQINFVGDANSKKYHIPSCKKAPKGPKAIALDSPMSAKQSGFKPCKRCKPPSVK